tara:strand:+ start:120 stop:506 length:387 start_codon:yes stop_codon:yes gene_type:complete
LRETWHKHSCRSAAGRENLAAAGDFLAGKNDPMATGPVPFLPVAGRRFAALEPLSGNVRQRPATHGPASAVRGSAAPCFFSPLAGRARRSRVRACPVSDQGEIDTRGAVRVNRYVWAGARASGRGKIN